MTQRTALLIAAGLTAFFLVAVGGLSVYLLQSPAAAGLEGVPSTPVVAGPLRPGPGEEVAGPALSPISPDRAALLALKVAPGATLSRPPDLVSYQGRTAYEVVFDRGPVYVDADSGRILYNGAAVRARAAAPPARGRYEDDGQEGTGDD